MSWHWGNDCHSTRWRFEKNSDIVFDLQVLNANVFATLSASLITVGPPNPQITPGVSVTFGMTAKFGI